MSDAHLRNILSLVILTNKALGLWSLSPARAWEHAFEILRLHSVSKNSRPKSLADDVKRAFAASLGRELVILLSGSEQPPVAAMDEFFKTLGMIVEKIMVDEEDVDITEWLALYRSINPNFDGNSILQMISNHWPERDITFDAKYRRAIQIRVIAALLLGFTSHRELLKIGAASEELTHQPPSENMISRAYWIAHEICYAESIRHEMGSTADAVVHIHMLWTSWLSALTGKAIVPDRKDVLVLSAMTQKICLRRYDPRASMDEVLEEICDQSIKDFENEILPLNWGQVMTAVKAIYPLTAPQS